MSSKPKIRFAFTIKEGPHASYSSGSWIAWTHREDVYIAPEELAGMWKVSLHSDVAWRLAMTTEHIRSGVEPQLPKGADRAVWKFVTDKISPPPFVDGGRLAFVVAATRASLLPDIRLDERAIHIAVEDRWDVLTKAQFWMTEPDVELIGETRQIGEPLSLASGRRLWVTAGTEETKGVQERDCVGSIIKPLSPAVHGVSVPGLIQTGVRVK